MGIIQRMPHNGRGLLLALIVALVICKTRAQSINTAFEIRAGKTAFPGDYFAVRYEHPTNYPIQLSAKIFFERSRKNQLNYSACGLDLLAEYPFDPFRLGIGPTAQIESEPWVYRNYKLSQRINYGICGEAAGSLYLTEAFSLTAFANQRYFFNPLLGRTSFAFGIGIKYSF